MKCLAIFLLSLLLTSFLCSITNEKNWISKVINFRNFNLKVITHYKIDTTNIINLLELADKRCGNKTQNASADNIGAIRKNDIIVVTQRLLLWFSASSKDEGRVVKSGGGLLSGSWELKYNKNSRKVFFRFSNKNKSIIANFLMPCSTPQIFDYGARIYGGYPASKIKWTLEATDKVVLGKKFGKDILQIGKGAYSADEGIYLEFKGVVTNNGIESGFESLTDTDPRPGIEGFTNYILSYRIPAAKPEIIQEIEFNTVSNNFGPITSPIISMTIPMNINNQNKYNKDSKIIYAANPEIIPKEKDINLKNVEINKYFRNTCVNKIYFYDINSNINEITENSQKNNLRNIKVTNTKKEDIYTRTVFTPLGRGKILCLGNPNKKLSFLCGYPNNDYIPKEYLEEYSLSIVNNQRKKEKKFYSLIYQLTAVKNKTLIFERGQKFILIMRYKFIDASSAVKA